MAARGKGENGAALQERDLAILRGLFEARVMTARHVAAVHFGGRYEAARKRLQKLKAAGYVGERPRRAYDLAVLFLTRKAFVHLMQCGTIADLPKMTWKRLAKRVRVSPLTLSHELQVQDVRAAFHRAVAQVPLLTLTRFNTWPLLFQFRAFNSGGDKVLVKPDGYLELNQSGQVSACHRFFLELDRSSETHETLLQRAGCYREYYRIGGLAERCGAEARDYEQFPFRVLIVCRNAERRNNLAEKLWQMRPPILTQIWLTTFDEATIQPLGPIWIRPADYRDATAARNLPPRKPYPNVYRRNIAKEHWIEEAITKHPLFRQES